MSIFMIKILAALVFTAIGGYNLGALAESKKVKEEAEKNTKEEAALEGGCEQ